MTNWKVARALLACSLALAAQRGAGELRLAVLDPAGLAIQAHGTLTSEATAVRIAFQTDADGRCVARGLPFGGSALLRVSVPSNPYSQNDSCAQ